MRLRSLIAIAGMVTLTASSSVAQRSVVGTRVVSDSLPRAVISLDSSFTYLGTQRFLLFDVANAEQHFFAELDGKRIKRFVWIQFEGYIASSNDRYDYSADSIMTLWNRPIHHNSSLRTTPTSEQRPESDGARMRRFIRERGLSFDSAMLYHRLVSIVDERKRNELMIIYMESPSIYGDSAAALARDASGGRVAQLLNLSLSRAAKSILIR